MLKRIRALLGRRADKAPTDSPKQTGREAARPPVHRGPKVVHRPIPTAELDPDAVKIVRRLVRFDHRAYLVGGCVRDLLLDRKPKDFDVGTSATPRQIKRLFRNCRIIGRRFRLAHIYFQNGKIIEVATFRSGDLQESADGASDDEDLLIRDDNVFGTLEQDALRRDFTINSLFYDPSDDTVIDHADGLGDLRRKLVRTIGDPEIRFREDPVRILRAIKFAARLDFRIESETLAALRETGPELEKAATARVLEEVNRFCRGGAARRSFEILSETGIFDVVFPEVAEGYARDEPSRALMLDLLQRMEEVGRKSRREIRTGEIFAVLLLPMIESRFGWKADGTAARPSGINLRQVIDDLLRPVAVRLRIPRREQEHCRQVLATLARMVPTRRLRRNVKRAILSRECLPDALWMLHALADRRGQEFAAAYKFWSTAAAGQPRTAEEERPAAPSARRGRRRSRRRSGSGRARAQESGRRRTASTAEGAGKKDDLPPPWDDDYFFAALPSAPEDAGDDAKGDRYGAAAVAPTEVSDAGSRAAAGEPRATEPDATPRPKRKRRPRRRRRKPSGARSSGSAGPAEGGESAGRGDSDPPPSEG